MRPANSQYRSELAEHFVREGRAALVLKLLTARFGALPDAVRLQVAGASISALDEIGERLLSARSLEEALG